MNQIGRSQHRTRVVLRSNNGSNTNGGVVSANANNDSSNTNSNNGSRLALVRRLYAPQGSSLRLVDRRYYWGTKVVTCRRNCPKLTEPFQTICILIEEKHHGVASMAFSRI